MKNNTLFLLLYFLSLPVFADMSNAHVIHVFKDTSVGGKFRNEEIVAGINMGDASPDCQQMIGQIKVEGVQFSQSGATLESFRFTDKNGVQWSIPTNFDTLSNVEKVEANSFIKTGKSYFVQVEFCGQGGYPDLINIYDMKISFGTKK